MKSPNVVFLSRICKQKNLLGAIRCIEQIDFETAFSIYGPIEDGNYWNLCSKMLNQLPDNIHWEYKGTVPTDMVQTILQQYDFLLFPTLSENYGHVIFEALSVGCIPIISDQTPWGIIKDRNAGIICPLTPNMEYFVKALISLSHMDERDIICISENAIKLEKEKIKQAISKTGYRTIFG